MAVQCKVPPAARTPTVAPVAPPAPMSIDDLLGYSLDQMAALVASEAKRGAAIQAVDDCNQTNAALEAKQGK